ncbi:MAG: twin-arginine translocase subunit TatC [Planctomycetota bacterium]|jgi:sec-independent protein translocase protein TatC
MAEPLKKMTFSEHFDELRRRLIYCAVSVLVTFVIALIFKDYLVRIVAAPYEALRAAEAAEEGAQPLRDLVFIRPAEKFLFYLKVCFLAAIFVSAPIILYQMWRFIGAGLYRRERRSVMRIVPLSVVLFLMGMAFGYFVLFPIGMDFLVHFGDPDLFEPSITVNSYFGLFALLIIVMGFIFQTPLIMVVTTSVGMTTPTFFSSKRKYFVLGAFVMSALLTPPDWVTQTLLAGPLIVLFEIGILLSKGVRRRRRQRGEWEEEDEDDFDDDEEMEKKEIKKKAAIKKEEKPAEQKDSQNKPHPPKQDESDDEASPEDDVSPHAG